MIDCSIERVRVWQRAFLSAFGESFFAGICQSEKGLISARLDWVTMGVL